MELSSTTSSIIFTYLSEYRNHISKCNFRFWRLDYKTIVKENLTTGTVSPFLKKHLNWINSLLLSPDQKTAFSGCDSSQLIHHSLHTLKYIQEIKNLDIGLLSGIDMKRNLLVVGGQTKFCLLRLTGKCGSDSYLLYYWFIKSRRYRWKEKNYYDFQNKF